MIVEQPELGITIGDGKRSMDHGEKERGAADGWNQFTAQSTQLRIDD